MSYLHATAALKLQRSFLFFFQIGQVFTNFFIPSDHRRQLDKFIVTTRSGWDCFKQQYPLPAVNQAPQAPLIPLFLLLAVVISSLYFPFFLLLCSAVLMEFTFSQSDNPNSDARRHGGALKNLTLHHQHRHPSSIAITKTEQYNLSVCLMSRRSIDTFATQSSCSKLLCKANNRPV